MVYLDKHLKKYPLMQLEDILKLYMQGILGPGHLVSSFDNCLKRINNEYLSMNKDKDYELIEEISDKYVRVYLLPYYKKNKDFTNLINAFINSSKLDVDINLFKKEIESLINKDNKEYIKEFLSRDNYLISHSQIYKDNYDPHYLVVAKEFIKDI